MANSRAEHFEYRVKAGDSLSMIIARFYGVGPRSPGYSKTLTQILLLNPRTDSHRLALTLTGLNNVNPIPRA